MGQFTWTYADLPLKINADGSYAKRCALPYGGSGALLTPDNEIFVTEYYEGSGLFNGQDAYALAAEWNRPHLKKLIKEGKAEMMGMPVSFEKLMVAWCEGKDDVVEEILKSINPPYLKTDWKRVIGISICCTHNAVAPYPIKVVKTKTPEKYTKYPASMSIQ